MSSGVKQLMMMMMKMTMMMGRGGKWENELTHGTDEDGGRRKTEIIWSDTPHDASSAVISTQCTCTTRAHTHTFKRVVSNCVRHYFAFLILEKRQNQLDV